jgi:hypothetical protein
VPVFVDQSDGAGRPRRVPARRPRRYARRPPPTRHRHPFDPGTRGRALLDGTATLKAHGRYVPVRAKILGLHEFSSHADADAILTWLRTAPRAPAEADRGPVRSAR